MPAIAILGYPLHGKDVFLRSLLLVLDNLEKTAPGAQCRPRDNRTAKRVAAMLALFRRGDLPQSSLVGPAEPLRLHLSGLPGFAAVDLDLYVISGEALYDPTLDHLLEPAARADALWLVASLNDLSAESRTLYDLYLAASRIAARHRQPPYSVPISLILSKADRLLTPPYSLPAEAATYLFNDHLRNIDLEEARYLPLFEPAVAMRRLRQIGDLLENYARNVLPGGVQMMRQAGSDGNFLEFCLSGVILNANGPRPLRALDPLLLTLSRWAKRDVAAHAALPRTMRLLKIPPLTAESVFISYKREDWDEFVYPLIRQLEQHGIPYWVDQRHIPNRVDWQDRINEALATCKRMILCLSPAALESRHVKVEYRYFFNNAHLNKELYLIMCRPTSLPPELQILNYYPYQRLPDLIDELREWPTGVR